MLGPQAGAAAVLGYGTSGAAGIGWNRGVVFGFPFETIKGADVRQEVMARTLAFLEAAEAPGSDAGAPDGGRRDGRPGDGGPGDDEGDGGGGDCGCRASAPGGGGLLCGALLLAAGCRARARRLARARAGRG